VGLVFFFASFYLLGNHEKKKEAARGKINSLLLFHISLVVRVMANFLRKFATLFTYVMPAVPYAKSNCLTLL